MLAVLPPSECHEEQGQHYDAAGNALPAVAVEGDAQHSHAQQEGHRHADAALLSDGLPNGPQHCASEQGNVDDDAGVEGHTQGVDKEQLEPSAHLDDAWHDAIEHGGNEHSAACQREQCALGGGILHLAVVEDEHEGRQAEQVEQMHADAETREVGDEDEPAVAARLVGMVFPLEHQPEDDGSEQAAVGIDLSLYCAEPEGVAEGIDQCAGQCTGLHRDELCQGLHPAVLAHELACQVTDAPEEEHDAGCTEEGAHHVDHEGDLCRVIDQLREEVGGEHEEGCPRRMPYFQLVSCGYELGAVPKARRGLHRAAIDVGCNGEGEPPHQVVDKSEMSHPL